MLHTFTEMSLKPMIFILRNKRLHHIFETVSKFLGVLLTFKLTWKCHVEYICLLPIHRNVRGGYTIVFVRPSVYPSVRPDLVDAMTTQPRHPLDQLAPSQVLWNRLAPYMCNSSNYCGSCNYTAHEENHPLQILSGFVA